MAGLLQIMIKCIANYDWSNILSQSTAPFAVVTNYVKKLLPSYGRYYKLILYSEKLSQEKLSRISRFLAFSRKLDLQKAPKIAIRESLSREFLVTFQFAKVSPVIFLGIFNPTSSKFKKFF